MNKGIPLKSLVDLFVTKVNSGQQRATGEYRPQALNYFQYQIG